LQSIICLGGVVSLTSFTQHMMGLDCAAANDSVIMEAASTQLGQVRALASIADTGRTGRMLACGWIQQVCAQTALRGFTRGRVLLQMPQPRSRSWAVRLLGLTYGIFCVIVLSSYTANLAAFLTVRLFDAH
jgi:Ligand-gated ion channel